MHGWDYTMKDKDNGREGTFPGSENRCASSLKSYMPTFEHVWHAIKGDDVWIGKIDEQYDNILSEKGIDRYEEGFEEDIKSREEAESEVFSDALKTYEYAVSMLEGFFSGEDQITVFRCINVEDINHFLNDLKEKGKAFYEKKWRGIGIYWSWDFERAVSYWKKCGKGEGSDIILEAVVDCEDVDFENTVVAYMIFSDEIACSMDREENEIRLKEGRQILLKKVYDAETRKEFVMEKRVLT
jgi:hypothetical protein